MKTKSCNKIITGAFIGISFILLFIFFTKINPIVVADTDDWLYIHYARVARPIWKDWNPTRILPEVLMRVCTDFGVYIIYPFLKDYIFSLTVAFAFFVSSFICIYLYRLMRFCTVQFNTSLFTDICVAAIFLISHFLAFRNDTSNNDYLFRANSAACYFYYTIPTLLNSILVMYFLENNNYSFFKSKSYIKTSILIVGIYFSIFSNLFQSCILLSLFSFIIIKHFVFRHNKSFISDIKDISIPAFGIFLWIVSAFFEFNGGRATAASKKFELSKCLHNLFSKLFEMNHDYAAFCVGIIIFSAILLFIKRKEKAIKPYLSPIIISLFGIAFATLYEVLLSSAVGSQYIKRSDVLICIFFYLLLLISILLCYLNNYYTVKIFMPLLCIVLCSYVFTSARTYISSNYLHIEAEKCIQLDNYLIDQIIKAESEGKSEIDLHVPILEYADNWPISEDNVVHISKALYCHHIIGSEVNVVLCPDENVNHLFGIEVPEEQIPN